jgi:hypothetical protein
VGPVGAVLQAVQALVLIALDPLVAGGTRDVVATAELGVGELGELGLEQLDEIADPLLAVVQRPHFLGIRTRHVESRLPYVDAHEDGFLRSHRSLLRPREGAIALSRSRRFGF